MKERSGVWLKQKKDLMIRNVLRDFCKGRILFNKIKKKLDNNIHSYPDMEELVGTDKEKGILWRLKDTCHTLWQDYDPQGHPEEFLLDWLIGALFHEAMKLKEDLYLLVRYKPAFEQAASTDRAFKMYEKCRDLFETAEKNVLHSSRKLHCMFDKAGDQLETVLKKEKLNPLLIRFFIQNKALIDKAWKSEGYSENLLTAMFPEGLDKAYCIAGEGYMDGSWYAEARAAFEKALELNPKCVEASKGLKLLEKRINEVTHILKREYETALAKNINDDSTKNGLPDPKSDIQEIIEGNGESTFS